MKRNALKVVAVLSLVCVGALCAFPGNSLKMKILGGTVESCHSDMKCLAGALEMYALDHDFDEKKLLKFVSTKTANDVQKVFVKDGYLQRATTCPLYLTVGLQVPMDLGKLNFNLEIKCPHHPGSPVRK